MARQTQIGRHATTISYIDGYTTVTYHRTPVVRFNYEEIILNTDGWQTATTKTRMNQTSNQYELDYHVHQENHRWFVYYKNKKIPFINNTLTLKR